MKFSMKKNEAGFSLVELMIVVGIIGILASLAVPKLQVFMAKAKQSEAKTKLQNVYVLEEAYFVENSAYSATLATIGYTMPKNNYGDPTITVATSGAPSYWAKITLDTNKALCGGVSADYWTVSSAGGIFRAGTSDPSAAATTNAALTCN